MKRYAHRTHPLTSLPRRSRRLRPWPLCWRQWPTDRRLTKHGVSERRTWRFAPRPRRAGSPAPRSLVRTPSRIRTRCCAHARTSRIGFRLFHGGHRFGRNGAGTDRGQHRRARADTHRHRDVSVCGIDGHLCLISRRLSRSGLSHIRRIAACDGPGSLPRRIGDTHVGHAKTDHPRQHERQDDQERDHHGRLGCHHARLTRTHHQPIFVPKLNSCVMTTCTWLMMLSMRSWKNDPSPALSRYNTTANRIAPSEPVTYSAVAVPDSCVRARLPMLLLSRATDAGASAARWGLKRKQIWNVVQNVANKFAEPFALADLD